MASYQKCRVPRIFGTDSNPLFILLLKKIQDSVKSSRIDNIILQMLSYSCLNFNSATVR